MYSSSKACSEIMLKSYQRSFFNINDYKIKHSVLIASARAGNVIGGGDWSVDRLIPDMVKAVAGKKITEIRNPCAVRPWQHVLDCVYGYLMLGAKLMDEEVEFAEAWNFAPYSFESKTVKEVVEISKSIWDEINVQYGNSFGSPHEANLLKLDNTKALSRLGWKPLWDTNQAITKTIEWYKSYYLTNNLLTGQQIEEYCGLNGIR